MKVIVIGGVAGGAGFAARLRRLNEKAEIIIFERTNYISYANCGLPYYIGDVITNESSLTLQNPKSFKSRFNIDVRVHHEVLKVDLLKKVVLVKNLDTDQEFVETYDKLLLSPGAKPIVPDFYQNSDKMFVVRTVEDTLRLKKSLSKDIKSAVIVGGGFIGIEMAENLANLGISSTIVDLNNQVLGNFDFDMVSFVHANLKKHGINLCLSERIVRVIERNNKLHNILESKKSLVSDILICAVGVMPDTNFLVDSGIDLGPKGNILVNEYMQTSNSDVYAVGDAVMVKHLVTGEKSLISLAGPAAKQARVAANHLCGIEDTYEGCLGTSILKCFDLCCASTGINEKTCKKIGKNYEKVILTPVDHASYYPGSTAMTLKVIYEKETEKLLGAQIIGGNGTDKRIDILSAAIKFEAKASSLKNLDLAYAPPFSSSKDPINLVGFMIDNIENKLVKQFHYEDLEVLRKKDVILLDTRTQLEVSRGIASGFINIPLDELRNRINELDKTKPVYVMCQSGLRSYFATRILTQYGFDTYNFSGGYRLYSSIYQAEITKNEIFECGIDKELIEVK